MEEFDQILAETAYSTRETVERMKNRFSEDEIEGMRLSQQAEESRIRAKYEGSGLSDEELMKQELLDYMTILINQINVEYSKLIPAARLQQLNDMLNSNSVIVFNDENDTHDFSANSENGKVIVNLARIGKTPSDPNPDIFAKIANATGTLPHELFHIIIRMLKPEDIADERMIIKMADGQNITSRGMVGFMLSEGFVEKFSTEFCEKNGFYHQIAPQYLPYVDVCNYIMEHYPQVNENTIFSLDEIDVLKLLSPEEQEKYYHAEMISYAVRNKGRKSIEVIGTSIEKTEINYAFISPEKLERVKQYYLEKNRKLRETSTMSPEETHNF